MGQLEKYGLYVLCLVIFLIGGVAIWGESPQPPQQRPPVQVPQAGANPAALEVAVRPEGRPTGSAPANDYDLDSLLRSVDVPKRETKPASSGQSDVAAHKPEGDAVRPVGAQAGGNGVPVTGDLAKARDVVASPRTYTVRSGDTLAEIAKRELGAESRYPEIQALNPGLDPKRLQPGKAILLPVAAAGGVVDAASVASKLEQAGAYRSYVVAQGDTLSEIAARMLGSSKRYPEILALNAGLSARTVRAGQTIKLPLK